MKLSYASLGLILFIVACKDNAQVDVNAVRQEVIATEKLFEIRCADSGVANAFHYYAASNAIIKRENDTLIKGKDAIKQYYSAPYYNAVKVTWDVEAIEIANDGSMASTYGKYLWISRGRGKSDTATGVFHTVWQKQSDGSWKFIWD